MRGDGEIRLEELRFRLGGELFQPGEAGYAEACAALGAEAEGRPALVARCSAPEDVVAAVAFARQEGLAVAAHGGGHAGRSWACTGAGTSSQENGAGHGGRLLALDLHCICDIEVDPKLRVARAGGGAPKAAIKRAAQRHSLVTTPWREGEPCGDLLAAQLVDAEGAFVRTSARECPEQLQILREGKPNSGVVISLDLCLHSLDPESAHSRREVL